MSITHGPLVICEPLIQGITLQRMVGGFELRVAFRAHMAHHENYDLIAKLAGGSINVRNGMAHGNYLGIARPRSPVTLSTRWHSGSPSFELHLPLSIVQIEAIERLRDARDLHFEITFEGSTTDGNHINDVSSSSIRHSVARSDWIQQLRNCEAADILLLEVRMPFPDPPKDWINVRTQFERAQTFFLLGQYTECVACCRHVLEAIGEKTHANGTWRGAVLKTLGSREEREQMSKSDRQLAILAALHHYTHSSHHPGSDGGLVLYDRTDAKMALSMAAALAANLSKT
jgi:hypothetical protein